MRLDCIHVASIGRLAIWLHWYRRPLWTVVRGRGMDIHGRWSKTCYIGPLMLGWYINPDPKTPGR
jgi:hypothetical protein